jgi:acyl-coenzyme A synthetase/AMP-(fatty) acid ligase
MDKLFLADGSKEYTYQKLMNDVMNRQHVNSYVYIPGNDIYELLVSIVHSLVYRYPIVLLDGDFSPQELERLGVLHSALSKKTAVNEVLSFDDVTTFLERACMPADWSISLYTSGTSGMPKRIDHSFGNLIRKVRCGMEYADHVWALAYNPTHIAGLQVFFQAFFNGNTMIYAFDGQQKELDRLINNYQITHLSATATFYRSVLPFIEGQYPSIRRVTFGGERYDEQLEGVVRKVFPNAKITNIYASTEAGSLFASKNGLFEVDDILAQCINVSDDGELQIHHSLLGQSDTIHLQGDWFETGDIVEFVTDRQFRFVSRKSELIHVGGYKVNPNEVEECLLRIPGIIDLVVKPKPNKITGYIIGLEVVKEVGVEEKQLKADIRKYATEHLQPWKVPRIIEFVDQIAKSRTTKKVR